MQTTIASFDQLNRAVAADVMPNPQCFDGCVVQRPTGGNGTGGCIGYLDPGIARVIGSPLWIVCNGDGIVQTGQTCNFPNADTTASDYAAIPGDAVPDDGSNPSEGTGLTPAESQAVQSTATNTSAIASSSQATASSVQGMASTLNGVRGDLVIYDGNNESRHTALMGVLEQMKDSLTSIDGKTGTGGGSGIPSDGIEATGATGEGPAAPGIEHPEGGLKSPGEGGLDAFKTTMNQTAERVPGACPTWSIQLDYFGQTYVMDAHCQLFADNRATIETIFTIIWSVAALVVVLKA